MTKAEDMTRRSKGKTERNEVCLAPDRVQEAPSTSEAEESRGMSSSESAVEWLLMPRSKSIWRPGKSRVLLLFVLAARR